jgi:hypothetical protein
MTTTQPPTSDAPTKMVAAPARAKLVKIRTLAPIMTKANGAEAAEMHPVGSVLEVEESVAKEFCDRRFEGYYAFTGERTGRGSNERHMTVRAERVA